VSRLSEHRGDRSGERDGSYSTDLIPARRRPSALPDLTIAAASVETTPDLTVGSRIPASEVRPRRYRAALGAALIALVLIAIGAVATYEQHERVDPSLDSARSELVQSLDRLGEAQTQLESTTNQAGTVEGSLASTTALLTQDKAQLAGSEARNFLQGVNISDLHLCLAGVERALNQFALGDRSGATATLATVTAFCREAQPVGT